MDATLLEPNRPVGTTEVEAAADLERAAEQFLGIRPRLIELAHRILGSSGEIEDVVQEAWVRWQRADRSVVVNPTAFLSTTTTRLALNLAQSARSRHEVHAEPWLLERADRRMGPEAEAELRDAVDRGMLLLVRNLTARERAAYVLREAFGYPYQQIADILLLTPAHVRQLVRRAHQRVAIEPIRPVNSTAHRRLVLIFRAAAGSGDLTDLERLFAGDVASSSPSSRGGSGQVTEEEGVGEAGEPARRFAHSSA
jgi:RNA polymerase sigma-70 factor (ECF subfamily)